MLSVIYRVRYNLLEFQFAKTYKVSFYEVLYMFANLGGEGQKGERLFFHLWIKIEHFLNWNVTGNTFGCDITLFFYLLKFIYE